MNSHFKKVDDEFDERFDIENGRFKRMGQQSFTIEDIKQFLHSQIKLSLEEMIKEMLPEKKKCRKCGGTEFTESYESAVCDLLPDLNEEREFERRFLSSAITRTRKETVEECISKLPEENKFSSSFQKMKQDFAASGFWIKETSDALDSFEQKRIVG